VAIATRRLPSNRSTTQPRNGPHLTGGLGGGQRHPECTPNLSIHFEGTLALAA